MADAHATLSPRAEKVIAALLSEQSIEDAAHISGIGARTIHRWLREDDAFQYAYRRARRKVVEQAQAQIQKATGRAVATLLAVMDDELAPPGAKVSAARTILEHAIRAVEIDDLTARIEALEALQEVSLNDVHQAR